MVYYPSFEHYGSLTIDQSENVIVAFNQTLFIESQYPFTVNGTGAKYIDYQYMFAIPTVKSTVVYVNFLSKPLPKNVHVVDLNEFKSSYAFIDFHLNETKNITMWLSTSFTKSDETSFMPYTTINSSTIVQVLKGYMEVLTSQYPFEINGTGAKFNTYEYTFSFFASGNTTLNVGFINNEIKQPAITTTQQAITPSTITIAQQQHISSSIFTVFNLTEDLFSSIIRAVIIPT